MPFFLAEAFVKIKSDDTGLRDALRAQLKTASAGLVTQASVQLASDKARIEADKLRAQLDKTFAGLSAHLKLDDAKAKLALADFGLRADRLQKKLSMNLSLDGVARAQLDLLKLQVQADRLNAKFGSIGGGLRGLLGKLLGAGAAGAATGAAGGAATGGGAIFGLSASTIGLIIVPLAALASIMAGPLLAALLPITLGFGALAVVFGSVAKDLTAGLGTLSTASDAYAQASLNLNQAIHKSPADMKLYRASLQGLEPDLRSAAALLTNQKVRWQDLSPAQQGSVIALANNKAALKGLLPDQKAALVALTKQKAAWDDLSPAQQTMSRQLGDLGTQFGKLKQAVQPEIVKIFGQGLRVIKDLMPALKPLLIAAAKAAEQFLRTIANWLESPSGKKFLHWLETQGPKDIRIFGQVLWVTAQVIGRIFSFLNNAGNTWWKNVSHVFHDVKQLFTVDFPGWARILRDSAKIIWDKMEIDVLEFVAKVVGTMGKLPGPLGAPFRAAHRDISAELGRLLGDVRKNEADIQATFDRLHGKKVTLSFGLGLPPGVSIPGARTGQRTAPIPGRAAGTAGAAPGWAWTGERGPELVHFRGGETVLNAHQSARVARGYAAGTWDVRDAFTPPVGQFLGAMRSAFAADMAAIIASVRKTAQLAGGFGGGSAPPGSGPYQAYARKLFPSMGWGMDQWPPFNAIVMQESGWNPRAQNPTSTAYGIGQFLDTTWGNYGGTGKTSNPYAQIFDMELYIKGRYGNPAAAEAFHLAHNSYAAGTGSAAPGLAMVGEHGPELVNFGGYAGGTHNRLNDKIDRVLRYTRRHGNEPARYTALEDHLALVSAQVHSERLLVRSGRLHGATLRQAREQLGDDRQESKRLLREIRPYSRTRQWVREVTGAMGARDAVYAKEAGAALAQHRPHVAAHFRGRVKTDAAHIKTMTAWLDRVAKVYTHRQQSADTRWIDSVIVDALRDAGLPVQGFDRGGWLRPGATLAINNTGHSERVGGGGGEKIELHISKRPGGPSRELDNALWDWLLHSVDIKGGGSVERALGQRQAGAG